MFELTQALKQWRARLLAGGDYLPSDVDELEAHLLDVMDEVRGEEWTEEEAFGVAVGRVGDADILHKAFSRFVRRERLKRPLVVVGVVALVCIVTFAPWRKIESTFREEIALPLGKMMADRAGVRAALVVGLDHSQHLESIGLIPDQQPPRLRSRPLDLGPDHDRLAFGNDSVAFAENDDLRLPDSPEIGHEETPQ